jgi:hypothetical protein
VQSLLNNLLLNISELNDVLVYDDISIDFLDFTELRNDLNILDIRFFNDVLKRGILDILRSE